MRVVCNAASWLWGEDARRELGLEILSALAKLGNRDAILAAVDGLQSPSSKCREAAVDILGGGALQEHPLAMIALEMCVRDEDQDMSTEEKILKARHLLSTASRNILHALDAHLEADEEKSFVSQREAEDQRDAAPEFVRQVCQRMATEGGAGLSSSAGKPTTLSRATAKLHIHALATFAIS